MPTIERSLPAVVLTTTNWREALLFDCGEGTQVRLRQSGIKPGKLSRIFISHLHADHVTGLLGLLLTLQMLGRDTPLYLYGPPGLRRYLETSRSLLQSGWAYPTPVQEMSEAGLVVEGPGYTVTCDLLEHGVPTLGYRVREADRPGTLDADRAVELGVPKGPLMGVLQSGEPVTTATGRVVRPEEVLGPTRPGRRVAYCTDTRPCPADLRLAQDVDLLIHEGTFASNMAEDAARKGHSTVTEAARVARDAGARRLAITHVSPRYSDPELLRAEAAEVFPNTTVVSDLQVLELPAR
jgi:ribonuclease Z